MSSDRILYSKRKDNFNGESGHVEQTLFQRNDLIQYVKYEIFYYFYSNEFTAPRNIDQKKSYRYFVVKSVINLTAVKKKYTQF